MMPAALPVRMAAKVRVVDNGCWLWVGAIDSTGYGRFLHEGKVTLTHRLSYELLVGPIPAGLEIDHLCRVRACLAPEHLEAVTHAENVGRVPVELQTHCVKGHPYEGTNVYLRKNGTRECRACRNAFQAAYKRRKKLERLTT
jgi:hypothetical protein